MVGQLFRFVLTGGLATATYSVVFLFLVQQWSWTGLYGSVVAYSIAIPVSFFMQRQFTFRSSGSVLRELPQFLGLQAVCAIVTVCISYVMRDWLGLHPLICIFAIGCTLAIINYLTMRLVIFRHRPAMR